MKKRILFFVLLSSLLSFGQQRGEVVLEWTDNVKSLIGTTQISIPQFQIENTSYDSSRKQLFFQNNLPVSAAADPNSLTITNIVYESMTVAQLGTLSTALPASVNAKLASSKARDQWYASITLSPIIKDGSSYKRVKSFTYSFGFNAGRSAFRDGADFDVIENSVLATGDWYRFYVEKSGVYKVTRSFLQSLGMNVNVDPRTIKIYGNGGRMVPLLNATEYPSDLAENAIEVIGEEDGSFGSSDYILFYAEGVDNWNAESGTHNNLFVDKSYYYVTAGGANGKRITPQGLPAAAPNVITSNFDEYLYHEKDLVNIARLGRKWHGEQFNVENEQSFDFNIQDIDSGPVTVIVSAAAASGSATSMVVTANDQAIGTISLPLTPENAAAVDGKVLTGTFTPSGGAITVKLAYNNNGVPGSNAWLDYIILKAKRKLQGNGKQFRFRYNDAASNVGVIQYNMSNASGIKEVWDITNIYDASKIINDGGQSQFAFKATLGEVRQYIALVPSDYYTPLREGRPKVANQNLKGTIFRNAQGAFEDVDYLIVTPAFLNASAEKLAGYHRTNSGLNVKVVNLENIYQEFSSGKQDVGAIRNFIKYIYFNASSVSKRIKYVNLFGDASFDYKDRIPNNGNIVPSFQAFDPVPVNPDNNYSTVNTFVSDDFFGFMDPTEGRMDFGGGSSDRLDLAIGRMLVNDKTQADEMVNKVFEYKAAESYGRWRNEYIMITDDLDNVGQAFIPQMELVYDLLHDNRPFVNVRKIHSDAFVQQASAGGQRYPEAKEQIIRAINYGALVVNYLGHGGEDGMASERIFEKTDAQNLTNKYKYPLFVTATCELTKFDNPYRPTVGEYLYWNPAGGAIAMVTTTRSIYTGAAYSLNKTFCGKLYAFTNDGIYPTMAEALMQTKQSLPSREVRQVAFIGDPALKMAIPQPKIVLTEVNDQPLSPTSDVLQSLAYVKLGGRVTDEGGSMLSNYNGELEVTVFDKEMSRSTLDNDNEGQITNFKVLGETIFRGNATVTNGQFEFGFIVPRDIRIPVGNGRVSFYSKKNNVLEDHYGYDTMIRIGGVNPNAAADTAPPKLRLYMNDESFISGGITNASPILLAFLEDEHGINTASGIGHDIIGILDGDETHPFVMNDYYETEMDNYKQGKVRFPFVNLEKGLHTLTFKAWDVYNNLVAAEIQFVVIGDDVLKLDKVLNYPNPFVSYTEFWFTHNRPFEPLDVQVQVFTVTGKIVKTINQSVTTDGFLCRDIKWDGRDDFGDRIGKGVYIYKLTVRSASANKTAEKYEKLVLL
ncbi:peptidase C25 [Flavobacterium album]|uniref:Peptidase C25 n=2 Tax=Flavobacterium album TaxID=2175091 RepID=A0A2S1R2J4_9FLAO|nr:type IX secretion system sortase PorU [Flavobacterium album]AWH86890.1 peptidase C25 [Flavobacterium album]